VAKSAGVPIVGMGGIQTWQDAAEFILAGATGVAIGTALFVDPATPNRVCDGLAKWMREQGVEKLTDLVGAVELPGDQPAKTPYP
jgi:dihydroorotate dehydrogenase (NAD+) catalytic subunit